MTVLAIDGGGTKTEMAVVSYVGDIISHVRFGPMNINNRDPNEAKKEFIKNTVILKEQCPDAFQSVTGVFAGIAGGSRQEVQHFFHSLLRSELPGNVHIEVNHDGFNALNAATLGGPGIVHIAGTGSFTFGLNANGEQARCGGWGWLTDSAGSGVSLGKQSLKAVFDEHDGTGKKTKLTPLVLDYFNADSATDLVGRIYANGFNPSAVAGLAAILAQTAEQGDDIAKAIIQHDVQAMIQSIRTVGNKLFTDSSAPIFYALAGGVLDHSKIMKDTVRRDIMAHGNYHFIPSITSPLGGAAAVAIGLSGIETAPDFAERFSSSEASKIKKSKIIT